MTKDGYPEAIDEKDTRMPPATRSLVQPWRAWWPPKPSTGDNESEPQVSKELGSDPWVFFKFENSKRFEKPWLNWSLKWPQTYNNLDEAPQPVHDAEAIRETLLAQGPDLRLSTGVPRTTSYLQFFADSPRSSSEKPYVSKIPPPLQGQAQINFGGEYHQVVLSDIAGYEEKFTLDVDGFQFVPGAYRAAGEEPTAEAYMDTMSNWLKQYLRCSEVFVFDCVTRHEKSKELGLKNCSDVARRVHCDQTPRSAIARIKLHMGDRAEALLRGRCRLINVWRPLVPLVEAYPLAACSFTTVLASDLVPVDIVYPHFCEESFEAKPSPRHRWYFRSEMTSQDIALLKVFDNKMGSVAYCAPHCGFRDPRCHSTSPRISIELRCMAFGESSPSVALHESRL